MYQYLMQRLEQSNLKQYEISNFGKIGHESTHNKVYWLNEEYYGFGAGASGYVDGVRYTNLNPVRHYIDAINKNQRPILTQTEPTFEEKMEEEMFLGLRMNQGVNIERFKYKFGLPIESVFGQTIENLLGRNLLQKQQQNISLTERGKVIGNEVFEAFLLNL